MRVGQLGRGNCKSFVTSRTKLFDGDEKSEVFLWNFQSKRVLYSNEMQVAIALITHFQLTALRSLQLGVGVPAVAQTH